MYWGLKVGILNIADYDPLGYELSCCSSILLDFLNLVQFYFGHTVYYDSLFSGSHTILLGIVRFDLRGFVSSENVLEFF